MKGHHDFSWPSTCFCRKRKASLCIEKPSVVDPDDQTSRCQEWTCWSNSINHIDIRRFTVLACRYMWCLVYRDRIKTTQDLSQVERILETKYQQKTKRVCQLWCGHPWSQLREKMQAWIGFLAVTTACMTSGVLDRHGGKIGQTSHRLLKHVVELIQGQACCSIYDNLLKCREQLYLG